MLENILHMLIFARMKIFFAIFFFLLLSTQLIPVKEVGEVLWNQTTNEEEVHHPLVKLHTFNKVWYLDFLQSQSVENAIPKQTFVILDEALVKAFHLEVLLQPPNSNYILA